MVVPVSYTHLDVGLRYKLAHSYNHIRSINGIEACFLLDIPFSTNPISEDELRERCKQLHHMGPEMVIMTSVPSKTHAVIAVYDGPTDFLKTYSIPLVPVKDVYKRQVL